MRSCASRCLGAVVILFALALPVAGQDFRGTISGIVADQSGGVLPGVTMVVTNKATGVAITVITDGQGQYQVPFLNPGKYTVAAELSGFNRVLQDDNDVRVAEVLRLDITMQTGAVEETITVTATSPAINSTTGITGTTVTAKQIEAMPLGDGTAYTLTRLAPGVMDSSDLHFARPMDNAGLGGIVTNGVQGGNEFMIDGAPNLSNARVVGFSPPSDAIEEFKVQTNAFDAQSGHTAGSVVNLALKSGSNSLDGVAAYFNRDGNRTNTPLLTERANGTKPTREYNRFTSTVGGPIKQNRTFFLGAFEHLRDVQPEPGTYTVPTEKMRKGDFSEFPTLIYDPLTTTGANLTRTPFNGNQIPSGRINPVAANYAAFYPLPNRPGTESNYFTNQLRPYDYNSFLGRVDHVVSPAHRIFGTTYFNKRQEDRYNWAQDAANAVDNGVINGFAVTKGFDYRTNLGLNTGYTATLSPTLLLDTRVSVTRFGEYRDPAATLDPATLGFSPTAVQMMNGYQYLPLMTFGTFSTTNTSSTIAPLGAQRSDWGDGYNRPMTFFSIAPTLSKFTGGHALRAGYDMRFQTWSITSSGYPGGRFAFNGMYTRASNAAPLNDRGQIWAQFLLGLPTVSSGNTAAPTTVSSQFEIASPGVFTQWYHGLFAQDDWRLNAKTTLNLGLRFEINPGLREAENRNLAGFNTTVANPIESKAQAAYALAPIPEIPVSSFRVPGGLEFPDGATYQTLYKLLPRASASFMLDERTVVRGGVGMFSYDMFFDNINQQGFSVGTPVLTTNDLGATFTGANLTNPIPSGQLVQPTGASAGYASALGQNLTANPPGVGGPQLTNNLVNQARTAADYVRWEASVQRDLGSGWVVVGSYIGSRGRNLPVFQAINNIPIQYLSTSRTRDAATETYLGGNVTNPFAGLVPGSTINGATVARQQLLRPFPEFGTFGIEQYTGSDRYHAASIQADRRFRNGNSFTVQYTRSSLRDKMNYLNPADGILEDRVSANDRPNRLSLAGSVFLPFGHSQRWGSEWGGLTNAVLGGWRVSGTYQYQSGFPLTWNTTYWDAACGDPTSLVSNIGKTVDGKILGLDVPAWDTKCFYFHDAAVQTNGVDDPVKQRNDTRIQLTGNNVRYFPTTLPEVRTHQLHLLDLGITKTFQLTRGTTLQVRIETINALNYTVLWNPDINPRNSTFGFINQDRNNPRDVQLGFRFTF